MSQLRSKISQRDKKIVHVIRCDMTGILKHVCLMLICSWRWKEIARAVRFLVFSWCFSSIFSGFCLASRLVLAAAFARFLLVILGIVDGDLGCCGVVCFFSNEMRRVSFCTRWKLKEGKPQLLNMLYQLWFASKGGWKKFTTYSPNGGWFFMVTFFIPWDRIHQKSPEKHGSILGGSSHLVSG